MTTHIIIQIFLAIIFGGGIAGLIKLPSKQKAIGAVVMVMAIIASFLLWFIK